MKNLGFMFATFFTVSFVFYLFSLGLIHFETGISYYYIPVFTYLIPFSFIFIFFLQGNKSGASFLQNYTTLTTILLTSLTLGLTYSFINQGLVSTQWISFSFFQTGDAQDFLGSTGKLLSNGYFDAFRGRPIANTILAGSLHFFNFDFSKLFLFLGVFAVLSIISATYNFSKVSNPIFSLIFCALIIDFIHDHYGGTSSEIFGFLLGLASFVFLLKSAQTKKITLYYIGIVLFCFTMFVRVGPFFMLPFLVLWGIIYLGKGKKEKIRNFIITASLVILCFSVSHLIARTITPNSGGVFEHGADAWYAIFVNGDEILGRRDSKDILPNTRWLQIHLDYPNLNKMPKKEMGAEKISIIKDQFVNNFLSGLIGSLNEYRLQIFRIHVYNFVDSKLMRIFIFLLALLGALFLSLNSKRNAVYSLFLYSAVGIFISIPFLYSGGSRVMAGVIAYIALFPTFGLMFIEKYLRKNVSTNIDSTFSYNDLIPQTLALIILIYLFTSGFVDSGMYKPLKPKITHSCDLSDRAMVAFIPSGSSFTITTETNSNGLRIFQKNQFSKVINTLISHAQFSNLFVRFNYTNEILKIIKNKLLKYDHPITVAQIVDLLSGEAHIVILNTGQRLHSDILYKICAHNKDGYWFSKKQPEILANL